MDVEGNRSFTKRGKRYKLTLIIHDVFYLNFSKLSRFSNPKYETNDGYTWKISLWTKRHSGKNYLCCTLKRKKDDGPLAVRFLVYCKLFIGPNKYAQSQKDDTFRQGSSMEFLLLPVSCLKQLNKNISTKEPVKLIVEICLQKISMKYVKGLSVSTQLEKFAICRQTTLENFLYPKQGSRIEDIKDSMSHVHGNLWVDVNRSFCKSGKPLSSSSQIRLCSYICERFHLLDIHGCIHASSKRYRIASLLNEERLLYSFQKTNDGDIRKEIEKFSRDGEISVLFQASRGPYVRCLSKKWIFYPVTRRKGVDLRNEMNNFFRNSDKGADLKIGACDKVLKVNRQIILYKVPVFEAMLSHDMIEKHSNSINIEDCSFDVLVYFLNFLYSGTFEYGLEWEDICMLYKMADKYFVKGSLRRICSKQLASRISLDNCDELLTFSDLLGDRDLKIAVTNIRDLYLSNVSSERWKNRIVRLCRGIMAHLKKG